MLPVDVAHIYRCEMVLSIDSSFKRMLFVSAINIWWHISYKRQKHFHNEWCLLYKDAIEIDHTNLHRFMTHWTAQRLNFVYWCWWFILMLTLKSVTLMRMRKRNEHGTSSKSTESQHKNGKNYMKIVLFRPFYWLLDFTFIRSDNHQYDGMNGSNERIRMPSTKREKYVWLITLEWKFIITG